MYTCTNMFIWCSRRCIGPVLQKGEYVYLYKHVHMVQQKMYRSSLTEVTCFSLSLASLRN